MDAWTGEVLAMATAPGIGSRDGRPYVSELWRDPAVLDGFEPGSSFKLFTAASLLSRALCDSSSIFDGHGDESMYRSKADMGGFFFHDVHPVGEVSLRVAFAVSSNIIFGTAASLLERQEFDDDLRRFGFGMSTGSGLPGETKGILRPADNWSNRSLPTLAIGQEISVSLLQMAAGFAALLTDGDLRVPRFVSSWYDENGIAHAVETTTLRPRIVPPEIIPVLRDFCRGVVEEEYGGGTAARVEGLNVGGKTGTAQVSEEGVRGYILDAYTANFVGVVPAEKPRLLCAIVVHRPEVEKRWGGITAASCFSRVISKILSGTELLDVSDVAQSAKRLVATDQVADVVVPRLVGLSAPRVVQASREAGLELASAPADPAARAVGQMPAAGSRVPSGAPIRVAWATGVRR
jgi:cell division protein FtsI (penicillin-binding protein 3)